MQNPFITERVLGMSDLVDRRREVELVRQSITNGGKLFVIGPRRYGKTSILRAAASELEGRGLRTLMFDVQGYTSIEDLVRDIIAKAATLQGNLTAGIASVKKFFGVFSPSVTVGADGGVTASLGLKTPDTKEEQVPLLIDALNRLEKLAGDAVRKSGGDEDSPVISNGRMGLILDEFQHLLKLGGDGLEGQLRAAVQLHKHLGYVFAGSQTALITDMVTNHARPFYRLGDNLFIAGIPREDFMAFMRRGFGKLKVNVENAALVEILDLSEDVPYNVQGLARACWQEATNRNLKHLSVEKVNQVYGSMLVAMDPIYAPQWGNLTAPQQRALLGVARYGGQGLTGRAVLKPLDMAAGTMQTSLQALEHQSILRKEFKQASSSWRFEDPLFKGWIRATVKV